MGMIGTKLTGWKVSIHTNGLFKEHTAENFADACDWIKQYVDVKDILLVAYIWRGANLVKTFAL